MLPSVSLFVLICNKVENQVTWLLQHMIEGWYRGQTETLFIGNSAAKRFVDVGLNQVLRLKKTSLGGQRLVAVPKGS